MKRKRIRQLAAVMFTDIVGYTAMMQSDEQDANQKRKRHKKVLESLIGTHRGKILQYYGDGSLSTFTSAVEAVTCAVEIQGELQKEPKIPVRIGLHIGDIVYDSEDIYGDGVNVASRVESLAAPGGVLVSDKVFDEIKNHPEFSTVSMGEFELKNVKRPLELFALTNKGLTVPTKDDLHSRRKAAEKSIAVLPFLNMSSDPENEYFSEGITEEIINVLVKVGGLNVTARTSSFAFKGKNMDVREIGTMLGVTTILEGSVRKAGNKVRITAQMIDTGSGFHIFSEDYDRGLEDIFAVQDEIALLITDKLRENLASPRESVLRVTPPTENLEAYDLYLKGRHNLRIGSFESVTASLEDFKKAAAMEPGFALPYIGISNAYVFLGISRLHDPKEAYSRAGKYAALAQKIDDNLAETHMALARIHFFYEWDMKKAKKSIAKALRLGPGSAEIHSTYSAFLLAEGNREQALVEAKIAGKLDPLSPLSPHTLAYVYYSMERYDEAVEQCDRALAVLPSFQQVFVLKAKSFLCAGEIDKALKAFQEISESPNRVTIKHVASALGYSKRGETAKIYDCLEKVKEQEKAGTAEFLNWSYALIYLALNDSDKMFYYLEKSLKD
ncbi:MAG: guanylate cyclase, partial [bacterium]|nr:guanylate cyclase [bacterium]